MNSTEIVEMFTFENDKQITIIGTLEEPWFIAKEVGQLLGIVNYRNIVARLEDYQKDVHSVDTLGGTQNVSIINESGLYEMIFSSKKKKLKNFKKWVFNEVLPSIRKKGKYELERKNELLNDRLIELEIHNETQNLLIEELEDKTEELEEKIRNLQYISNNRDTQIGLTERIIELGHISQRNVNNILRPRYVNMDDRMCSLQHPDQKVFIGHLAKISSNLSKRKKQLHNEYPPISREHRTNIYYRRDYDEFGDNIINDYFENRHFNDWGIDVDWMTDEIIDRVQE